MSCQMDELFTTGKVNFNTSGNGVEWTFSATGDYGLIPAIADNVARNGIDQLAIKINELIKADVSVTNLEVGLTSADDLGGKGVRGDRELFIRMHSAAPFSIYSFANNHIRDAGSDALRKTFEIFKEQNILYVGGGIDKSEAERPLFIDCKGVKLGILAFAQKENQIAGKNLPGAAELIAGKVIVAAQELVGECDVPIVIMHEGYEYMDFPRVQFMELCRKLVTLGVKFRYPDPDTSSKQFAIT